MKLIFKLSIIILILSVFLINTQDSYAQIPTSIDGVNISKNIDNPRPDQIINVKVESFLIDLNSSSISWIVNGKSKEQGIGLKNINVTAPKIGLTTTVTAIIRTSDGVEIRKSITLKSGSVEIIWETEGHRHPLYEGKLPFVYQNKIRLIAMPHLSKDGKKTIDPKTLVYTWKSGGKYIENGQGYGKQYVEIIGTEIPKPLEISVEVYDRSNTTSAYSSIVIEPEEPSISFYEEDSLYGLLYNKSLRNRVPLNNSEMKVVAVPFGFNIGKEPLSYAWSINNLSQPDLIRNKSIVIKPKADVEGSSNISLDIRNENLILQGARSDFTVYFSKKKSDNVEEITF